VNVVIRRVNGVVVEYLINGVRQPLDSLPPRRELPTSIRRPKKRITHPGDLLSIMIYRVTGRSARACDPCVAHMIKMNEKGWIWCFRNRHTIYGWLAEAAAVHKIKVDNASAAALFRAAWRELMQSRRTTAAAGLQ
jgi:hypothetical protein